MSASTRRALLAMLAWPAPRRAPGVPRCLAAAAHEQDWEWLRRQLGCLARAPARIAWSAATTGRSSPARARSGPRWAGSATSTTTRSHLPAGNYRGAQRRAPSIRRPANGPSGGWTAAIPSTGSAGARRISRRRRRIHRHGHLQRHAGHRALPLARSAQQAPVVGPGVLDRRRQDLGDQLAQLLHAHQCHAAPHAAHSKDDPPEAARLGFPGRPMAGAQSAAAQRSPTARLGRVRQHADQLAGAWAACGNVGDNMFDAPVGTYRGMSLRAFDARSRNG